MGRVLVTGAAGFLGSHLVRRLVEENHEVRSFVRDPALPDWMEGMDLEVVVGDIRDADAVRKAVAGTERVFHLVSNFRKGGSDESDAHDINVLGTRNVLEAALRHGIDQLLHCSTIGVHGDVKEIPADETTPFNPGDLYQKTKLIAEREVWRFHREKGLPVTVIRPISMFGPGDRRMLKLFRMIQRGWVLVVGSGEVYFQPAYVEDVVEGFMLSVGNPSAIGDVFIVGGDEYVPLNELFSMIAEELDVDLRRVRVPMRPVLWLAAACERACRPLGIEPPLHRRRVSFYQNDRAFSVEKAKRVLGFEPRTSLREGIRKTIEWYRDHDWL